MKKTLLKLTGSLTLIAICAGAQAQIVSGNVFLKGNFVEMGMNQYGVYVSNVPAPAGYHNTEDVGVLPGLGLIADQGKDGWATGTPSYCGDYYAPGSPEEGFVLQVGPTSYRNTYYGAPLDIPGSWISYLNTATTVTATWKGYINYGGMEHGIELTQTTSINKAKSYYQTTIQVKNNTATTLSQVYYTRNSDPDNEQVWTGDFTTNNVVLMNHPTDVWACVTATGLEYGCYIAMCSNLSNSVVSRGGFSTSGVIPKNCYTGVSPWTITGTSTADEAIQINFKLGNIPAGATKACSYITATVEADLDLFAAPGDVENARLEASLNGGTNLDFSPDFRVSPNPSHGQLNIYGYDMDATSEVSLQIVNLMGEVVYTGALENASGIVNAGIELDPSLANGTYFANIMVDGKAYPQPFILAR